MTEPDRKECTAIRIPGMPCEKLVSYLKMMIDTVRLVPWEFDLTRMDFESVPGANFVLPGGTARIGFNEWFEKIHPDDRHRLSLYLEQVMDGSLNQYMVEYRIMKMDSEYVWIRAYFRVSSRDENGKPLIISGFNQDISEMKYFEQQTLNREQKLRDSESRLKNSMKLGRMSPWEYDFSEDRFITDRQMAGIWGFLGQYEGEGSVSLEDVMNRLHPDERYQLIQKFRQALPDSDGIEMVCRILVGEATRYVHFMAEIVRNVLGVPLKMIGMAQDITGIKAMEDSLARQYEGLRFIMENVGLGLMEMDAGSRTISMINSQFFNRESVYSVTFDEFLSRIHPEDIPSFRRRFDFHINGMENLMEAEVRYLYSKETYKWFHFTSVISRIDESGNPLILKGLYLDITERKEMESRFFQCQKMDAIGRLAGGVAHDFNNILQVIVGYGSLALMETEKNGEMFSNICNIMDSAEKAKKLVHSLLLFARKDRFIACMVSLNDLMEGFISMIKRIIRENITLVFSPGENLGFIHGDTGQLEQIFMNLCINSRDAITSVGSIVIETSNIEITDYTPCFDSRIPPGSYVRVSVKDDGSGIPAENLDKIFEPFFTTKVEQSGTGLGLSTVYSIVKQHNAYIDIKSRIGEGTTVTIYFPAYEGEQSVPVEEEQDHILKKVFGSGTILLAEDDGLIRRYTKKILSESGYSVIEAGDGESAVRLFNESRGAIDLLILDVIMPVMNGWDVYMEIGARELGLPVIFFSGYDRDILPANIADGLPIRYIQKPFKYSVIIKAIHELMQDR